MTVKVGYTRMANEHPDKPITNRCTHAAIGPVFEMENHSSPLGDLGRYPGRSRHFLNPDNCLAVVRLNACYRKQPNRKYGIQDHRPTARQAKNCDY